MGWIGSGIYMKAIIHLKNLNPTSPEIIAQRLNAKFYLCTLNTSVASKISINVKIRSTSIGITDAICLIIAGLWFDPIDSIEYTSASANGFITPTGDRSDPHVIISEIEQFKFLAWTAVEEVIL